MEDYPEYNPIMKWKPPTLMDTPMIDHATGTPVPELSSQPKNQLLFRLLKGVSDTRTNLDNAIKTTFTSHQ